MYLMEKTTNDNNEIVIMDKRPIKNSLFGIPVPAYPFNINEIEQDIKEIKSSETLLELVERFEDDVMEQRRIFVEQVKAIPAITDTEGNKMVKALMTEYFRGSGCTEEEIHRRNAAEPRELFIDTFINYHAERLKDGDKVLKGLMYTGRVDELGAVNPIQVTLILVNDDTRLLLVDERADRTDTIDVTECLYGFLKRRQQLPFSTFEEYVYFIQEKLGLDIIGILKQALEKQLWGYKNYTCFCISRAEIAEYYIARNINRRL